MPKGLFVAFSFEGEPRDRELPAIGPLDSAMVKGRMLVAPRGTGAHQAQEGVAIDRWVEAELEFQRAVGEEPGGPTRNVIRVSASDGVFVRLFTTGTSNEPDPMPELGPFTDITVGPRSLIADGRTLATRDPSANTPWQVADGAGASYVWLQKPDLAFRAAPAAEQPAVAPPPRTEQVLRPPPEPAFTLPPREEKPAAPPIVTQAPRAATPPQEAALKSRDLQLLERIESERTAESLRTRLQAGDHRLLAERERQPASATTFGFRPTQTAGTAVAFESDADEGGGFGDLLWRLRFVLIGLLLISAGVYGYFTLQDLSTSSGPGGLTYRNLAQRVEGPRWDYVVQGIQRVPTAGTARARGVFYVVRLDVTNRGTEGATISPGSFTLIDANGTSYGAASGVYQGSDNQSSPYVLLTTFPVEKPVTLNVLFEVEPSLGRGNLLVIADVPNTRVRLD